MATTEERYAKGREIRTRLNGGTPPGPRAPLYNLAEGMDEWMTAALYGDVWSRPGLDLKTRSIVTISTLAALGGTAPQLRTHIKNALNIGCTKEEISEVFFHVAIYAGMPAALNALRVVQEVLDERGL